MADCCQLVSVSWLNLTHVYHQYGGAVRNAYTRTRIDNIHRYVLCLSCLPLLLMVNTNYYNPVVLLSLLRG